MRAREMAMRLRTLATLLEVQISVLIVYIQTQSFTSACKTSCRGSNVTHKTDTHTHTYTLA